ncbi:FliH/SctL family protein [Neobacillus citreus]|nr:FliH/SctL family protein [Neobacillus citreus]MCH6266821.1 flagellar assembly protein FliH [Neobacillus citreus]
MNSYSKVFKASDVSVMKEVRVLSQHILPVRGRDGLKTIAPFPEDSELQSENFLQEVEEKAAEIIKLAEERALAIEQQAHDNIGRWWEENRTKLEAAEEEAKQRGYQEGFQIGSDEARVMIEQGYQEKINHVQQLLEQAYKDKETIIAEAEPFLLELSTTIAEHIIKKELTAQPGTLIEIIKQHILRFKEKEFITICVHPEDFEFIQSERNHLLAVVNGETEIKIIPDHSVTPKGCIIRTAYGSVDARIDTQIEEIKKVILGEKGRDQGIGSIS